MRRAPLKQLKERAPSIGAVLAHFATARFTWLFVILAAICAGAPFMHEGLIQEGVLDLLFLLLIILAIWSAGRELRLVTALLAIPALGGRLFLPFTHSATVILGVGFADLLFLIFITLVILSIVLRHEDVTLDTISGALAAYFLLGLVWGVAYGIVQALDPNAFAISAALDPTSPAESASRTILIYFSLVTIASVGYGDIAPVSAAARSLASLEGLVGQLFLAVLIARLVGIHSSRPRKS